LQNIYPDAEIFFVMGADSWEDILTWREWEKVLLMTNHIVVTRPGHEIGFGHVSDAVRERIVDLRGGAEIDQIGERPHSFITDAVNINLSATELRRQIRAGDTGWENGVPIEVAKYIQKYEIYK
jgi:nicotinate-nucleotide adenylyltransferase